MMHTQSKKRMELLVFWRKRMEIRVKGNELRGIAGKLRADYARLRKEALYDDKDDMEIYREIVRYNDAATKLVNESNKFYDVSEKIWKSGVVATVGKVAVKWKYNEKLMDTDCIVDGIGTFKAIMDDDD